MRLMRVHLLRMHLMRMRQGEDLYWLMLLDDDTV